MWSVSVNSMHLYGWPLSSYSYIAQHQIGMGKICLLVIQIRSKSWCYSSHSIHEICDFSTASLKFGQRIETPWNCLKQSAHVTLESPPLCAVHQWRLARPRTEIIASSSGDIFIIDGHNHPPMHKSECITQILQRYAKDQLEKLWWNGRD